jgi:hypothetical protein
MRWSNSKAGAGWSSGLAAGLCSASAVQEVAQALGHRQHPLPHRQSWQDVIGEMGRGRHHAPGIARRAHARVGSNLLL